MLRRQANAGCTTRSDDPGRVPAVSPAGGDTPPRRFQLGASGTAVAGEGDAGSAGNRAVTAGLRFDEGFPPPMQSCSRRLVGYHTGYSPRFHPREANRRRPWCFGSGDLPRRCEWDVWARTDRIGPERCKSKTSRTWIRTKHLTGKALQADSPYRFTNCALIQALDLGDLMKRSRPMTCPRGGWGSYQSSLQGRYLFASLPRTGSARCVPPDGVQGGSLSRCRYAARRRRFPSDRSDAFAISLTRDLVGFDLLVTTGAHGQGW